MTDVTEHYMSGECAGAQFIDESRYLAGEHRFYNRRRAYAMVFDGVPQPQLRAALRTFRNDPNRNEMHRNVHVRGPLPELCMECTCHCCSDRHFRCRNPCACLCNMQRNPLVHASLLRISRCWASPAVVRVRDIVFELIAFLHICIVLVSLYDDADTCTYERFLFMCRCLNRRFFFSVPYRTWRYLWAARWRLVRWAFSSRCAG